MSISLQITPPPTHRVEVVETPRDVVALERQVALVVFEQPPAASVVTMQTVINVIHNPVSVVVGGADAQITFTAVPGYADLFEMGVEVLP